MANIFVISDTHFSHAATLNFDVPVFDAHGTPTGETRKMRPFSSVEEMDEYIVAQWNAVVRPNDKIYHLGDVAMRKPQLSILSRLNGHKRLVRGNHDIFPTKYYTPYFEDIYGVRVFEDMILSHFPLHPESIKERWTNVHGHVHCNVSLNHFGPKYFNACVEYHDYTPIALEDIRHRIRQSRTVAHGE